MTPQLFQLICFYAFSIIAVASALLVITLRNPVHAVLSLILAFFNVAAIWLLAQAEFLGIVLIVVYVGAVMVLFLFVVMMLDINTDRVRENFIRFLPVGIAVAVIMLLELLALIGVRTMGGETMGANPATQSTSSNTAWLGHALYSQFLLPFEIAALILTVGVIAAVALTLRHRVGVRRQNPGDQVRVKITDRVRVVKMETVRRQKAASPKES